jgi:N-sulfoglucosamine sulfohydrolase
MKMPNILVVICHDLGRHLGCYGIPEARTPNIDAFASNGHHFGNSFCVAPQCSPSRAALWTGRYPHANGVIGLAHSGFANELFETERHLSQILSDAGYSTHLFGDQHVSHDPERCGFQHIHDSGTCGHIADDFSDFLQGWQQNQEPLFAQIAFFEPHRPFPHDDVVPLDPQILTVPPYLPDIPAVRNDLADFEASIASVDLAFGRVLKGVEDAGMAEDTIVIFTSDHGIPFPRSKMSLYDPGIEIALLIRVPGVIGPRRYSEMVPNIDILPTILDLGGIDIPGSVQGRSFRKLITGENYEPHREIFAEKTYHTYYDPMRTIRTEKWKLIANFEFAPRQETPPDYDSNARGYVEVANATRNRNGDLYHPIFELYDLRSDPHELCNLADDPKHIPMRDELVKRLRLWMRDTGDPLLDGPMAQGAYRRRMQTFLDI